jgi:hypothetical protein
MTRRVVLSRLAQTTFSAKDLARLVRDLGEKTQNHVHPGRELLNGHKFEDVTCVRSPGTPHQRPPGLGHGLFFLFLRFKG